MNNKYQKYSQTLKLVFTNFNKKIIGRSLFTLNYTICTVRKLQGAQDGWQQFPFFFGNSLIFNSPSTFYFVVICTTIGKQRPSLPTCHLFEFLFNLGKRNLLNFHLGIRYLFLPFLVKLRNWLTWKKWMLADSFRVQSTEFLR